MQCWADWISWLWCLPCVNLHMTNKTELKLNWSPEVYGPWSSLHSSSCSLCGFRSLILLSSPASSSSCHPFSFPACLPCLSAQPESCMSNACLIIGCPTDQLTQMLLSLCSTIRLESVTSWSLNHAKFRDWGEGLCGRPGDWRLVLLVGGSGWWQWSKGIRMVLTWGTQGFCGGQSGTGVSQTADGRPGTGVGHSADRRIGQRTLRTPDFCYCAIVGVDLMLANC